MSLAAMIMIRRVVTMNTCRVCFPLRVIVCTCRVMMAILGMQKPVVMIMDMTVIMVVVMPMRMPMIMSMSGVIFLGESKAVYEHGGAKDQHNQAGKYPQPRVKRFRVHMIGSQGGGEA